MILNPMPWTCFSKMAPEPEGLGSSETQEKPETNIAGPVISAHDNYAKSRF
jgi:hypothetical protein